MNRGTEGHNGIFCDRVIGSLSQLDQTIRYIKEVRLSAVVFADVKPIVPSFNIFRLSDFDSLDRAYSFWGSKDWTEAGMKAGKYYKGITIFQMILYQSLHQWASGWSNFLAELDRAVTIKVCAQRIVFATKFYINTYFHIQPEDIPNHEKRNELMLDDRELKKSDLYFEALQLLRYMTEWIDQSEEDIAKLLKDWEEQKIRREDEFCDLFIGVSLRDSLLVDELAVSGNWEIIRSKHGFLVEGLLKDINRRTEDIKSLRDGVSYTKPI